MPLRSEFDAEAAVDSSVYLVANIYIYTVYTYTDTHTVYIYIYIHILRSSDWDANSQGASCD